MKKALLLALGLLLLGGCADAFVDPLPKEAVLHRATTRDGWELALVQYRPVGPARGRPVLLCHGISANDRNMDMDAQHSLARWLAAQGREAWTLSLRGTGISDAIAPEKGRTPGYSFDTLWQEDLTAAIRYVRETSGADTVDYVGHSMGGMLVYAYLSQGGGGLNAVATLGSPTRLDWGSAAGALSLALGRNVITPESVVPVQALAALSVPLQGQLGNGVMERLLYNPENTTVASWKRFTSLGVADISGAVLLQLAILMETGQFQSLDGEVNYRRDMARVRTPVLVVAGKKDRIAPPMAVRDGFRALGGPKAWLLVARENGAQAEYGHMDLVIGERAAREVWTPVLAFLDAHAGPAPRPLQGEARDTP